MKLDVPLVLQKKGTKDCGLAGVAMLFKYHGLETSIDSLRKEIDVDETGTYAPQLGSYMIRNGFDVEIVTMHPALFTIRDTNLESRTLVARLEKMQARTKSKQNHMVLGHFLDYLRQGGRVKVKIPDYKDVQSEIRSDRPVGALLTSNFLNSNKPSFNFHFNLITGIDAQYVYVNDPWPGQTGGRKKHRINEFFYGIYSSMYGDLDNGCLIKARIKR